MHWILEVTATYMVRVIAPAEGFGHFLRLFFSAIRPTKIFFHGDVFSFLVSYQYQYHTVPCRTVPNSGSGLIGPNLMDIKQMYNLVSTIG